MKFKVCYSDSKNSKFRNLGSPERIWAIPAIHGAVEKLIPIHDNIISKFKCGDRIVYLGNYTGHSEHSAACIDEILTFRRMILSIPGVICDDLAYLRGAQEEMWQKLLQLPFAPDPTSILLWMLGNGMTGTLLSYGLSPHDGIEACRNGVMALTKWTNEIRAALRRHPGHETFSMHLLRAVYTSETENYPMLFVHAGINPKCTLDEQGDYLWWAGDKFKHIDAAYKPFEKVIRGYDPEHAGMKLNCITATLDDGCGFGGPLVCTGFASDGQVFEMLEA